MKYFKKLAVEVTQTKKFPTPHSSGQGGVVSRTTPRKQIGKMEEQTTQQPKPSNTNPIQKQAKLKDDWEQAKYLAKHKYYLVSPGRQLGLGYGQLLTHDLSKLRQSEWVPYREFFYGDEGIRGENTLPTFMKFKDAVQLHYSRNPHHRQNAKYMSDSKYRLEEVADWYAAAKAQSDNPKHFPAFKDWYESSRPYFNKRIGPITDTYIRMKVT